MAERSAERCYAMAQNWNVAFAQARCYETTCNWNAVPASEQVAVA